MAIPVVSDRARRALYHSLMAREVWEDWGKRFRAHCRREGVKRSTLAAALEKESESGIRHYENGTRIPKLDEFFKLCKTAKADPVEILFGIQGLSPEKRRKIKEAAKILEESET